MIRLRPLTDASGYTCDWGGCDEVATDERATGDPSLPWLPVCYRHSGRGSHRGKASRGVCAACGKEYALSAAGMLRAHDVAFALRCGGSGKAPERRSA